MRVAIRALGIVLALAFALVTATAAPALGQQVSIGREPAMTRSEWAVGFDPAILRAAANLRGVARATTPDVLIELERLDEFAARREPPTKPAPLRIGTVRTLPDLRPAAFEGSMLQWSSAPDGGFTTTLGVRSPGAHAVQMSVTFTALPAEAEVRFFSPAHPDDAQGPFGAARLLGAASGESEAAAASVRYPFWSTPVDGERAALEIWVPVVPRLDELAFTLGDVGHLWNDPIRPQRFEDMGESQACEIDIACFPYWVNFISEAVAKYTFNDGTYLYLCTGTVMNDKDPSSYRPFFLTAAHCVSRAAEASTMTLYWDFWRASCGGANPGQLFTTNGAMLHYTSGDVVVRGSTDHTLLELYESPPGDYVLSGWDADDVTKKYKKKQVHGIHHPAGDLMMGSKGKVKAFKQVIGKADGGFGISNQKPWTHIQVVWKQGVTEGGSSGSGLWAGTNADNARLIGVLTGGGSYCSAPKSPDYYGRFDVTYNGSATVRRLLGGE